jgi:hypothetical protein
MVLEENLKRDKAARRRQAKFCPAAGGLANHAQQYCVLQPV